MSDIQRIVVGGQFCGNRVTAAIRRGELLPPATFQCVDCYGPATEYDHRDYNFPLLVEPVCRSCNARRGKAVPRRWSRPELFELMHRAAHRQRVVPWARDFCLWRLDRICSHIEKHAGIPRHELRPDIFEAA